MSWAVGPVKLAGWAFTEALAAVTFPGLVWPLF